MELVERIKQLKAERKHYFDVEGDGVDVLLTDVWSFLEARPTADLGEDGDADWLRNLVKLRFASERTDIGDRIDRIADRLILYREALAPFAAFADHQDAYGRADSDSFCSTIINGATGQESRITCGDLRKARAVLSRSGEKPL